MARFRSSCEECSTRRMEIARLTLEESSLNAALRYAKRLRDVVLLQSLYEKFESLRNCRAEAQAAYRLHRDTHSRPSWAA
jgi:hypothetical protein